MRLVTHLAKGRLAGSSLVLKRRQVYPKTAALPVVWQPPTLVTFFLARSYPPHRWGPLQFSKLGRTLIMTVVVWVTRGAPSIQNLHLLLCSVLVVTGYRCEFCRHRACTYLKALSSATTKDSRANHETPHDRSFVTDVSSYPL